MVMIIRVCEKKRLGVGSVTQVTSRELRGVLMPSWLLMRPMPGRRPGLPAGPLPGPLPALVLPLSIARLIAPREAR